MVLDNSSSPQSDNPFDSAPTSDKDPYSESNSPSVTQYRIDGTKLPSPVPIVGPLFGFSRENSTKVATTYHLQRASATVQRPLTQEEANALAFYAAKGFSIASYGPPVGISFGWARAYNTKDTFRFPFWQPNLEKLDTNIFPSARYALVRGNQAVIAWHILRAAAYGAVGKWFGQLFFGSYAASVCAVGQVGDPRLKDFTRETRKKIAEHQGSRLPEPRIPPRIPPQTPQTQPQRGMDDASPTGEVPYFEEEKEENKPQMRSFPQARQMPRQPEQEKGFDMFDDASPTGGIGTNYDTDDTKPQESAWERLRRGEKPARQQSSWSKLQNEVQKEQRVGSTTGDQFAFSKTEEERSFAKTEAQKEFDARVEKERRGGDFSGGNGDQKRW